MGLPHSFEEIMISFVIPAFNEEGLLARCIESIKLEALDTLHEIIVVDNNSTDNTAKVAERCGAVVVTEQCKGITRARQTGFRAAKYDIIAFIDADNELPPGWVKYALKALCRTNYVAASGPIVYWEMSIVRRLSVFCFYLIGKVTHQFYPMLQGGNFVVRKNALALIDGFDTSLDFYGEDTDTAVRLSKIGLVAFDLDMFAYSSSRRMDAEGLLKIGVRYMMNYIWIWAFGKPWTIKYHDHRPD